MRIDKDIKATKKALRSRLPNNQIELDYVAFVVLKRYKNRERDLILSVSGKDNMKDKSNVRN